jgi:phospholipase A-2-activating protein
VFAVKALKLGKYVSGGEDRVLKFWEESSVVQDIPLPCSVWSLAFDENEDIFAAGSDGFIRSFTTNEDRRADQDVE